MADFIGVITFGPGSSDIGAVWSENGGLFVLWPDGHADTVFRDRRGWLWDEYGDMEAPMLRGQTQCGTRLPIVSRRRIDIPDGCVPEDRKPPGGGA